MLWIWGSTECGSCFPDSGLIFFPNRTVIGQCSEDEETFIIAYTYVISKTFDVKAAPCKIQMALMEVNVENLYMS